MRRVHVAAVVCQVAGLVASAVAQPSVPTGRYIGSWANTSAGQSTPARWEVFLTQAPGLAFTFRLTSDGLIWGGTAPGPLVITLTQQNATTWSGSVSGDPSWGNASMTLNASGTMTFTANSMPSGTFTGFNLAGTINATTGATNLVGIMNLRAGGTANGSLGLSIGLQSPYRSPSPQSIGLFGVATAGVGDLDGDGRGDLLVGAVNETANGFTSAGRAYAISSRTGLPLYNIVDPAPELGGAFGSSIHGMADVNGDGVNDFIVGATLQNPGSAPVDIGRAYLYSGSDGRLLARLPPNNPTAGAQYGWSVSGVPDIDGDGRPDIIVGAPFYNVPGGSNFRGGIWLYRGGDWGGNIAPRLIAGSPAENDNFEFFGFSVTGLRDVTGDGRGDYVVGSPQSLSINATGKRGRVYLYNGFTGALVRNLTTPSNQNDSQFGHSVFNIPDVTGDGRNDFLVGAPNETVNGVAGAGRVYVYNGVTGELVYSVASPIPTLDGQFGFSVAGGPDINGDGRGDFIVGAPGEWVNGSGRVHIFSGANGALIRSVSSLFQTPNGNYGRSVHRVPDVNGDGKWEFLIGALRESVPLPGVPTQSGVVYLLRNP